MRHRLATCFCLAVALVLYAMGMSSDAQGVIVVGMCFEGLFWMRVFRKRSAAKLSLPTETKY